MPKMDGYEACQELRRVAKQQPLPILILTRMNDVETVSRAYKSGASD